MSLDTINLEITSFYAKTQSPAHRTNTHLRTGWKYTRYTDTCFITKIVTNRKLTPFLKCNIYLCYAAPDANPTHVTLPVL